jgi:Hint module
MALPRCCNGADKNSTRDIIGNFCVSAGCAGHTDDPLNPDPLAAVDDDYFNGGPDNKTEFCQTGCEYPYQCAEGLTCLIRSKGDPFPTCCEAEDEDASEDEDAAMVVSRRKHKDKEGKGKGSSENYCVPYNCTSTTPAPTPPPSPPPNAEADPLGGLCFSGETIVTIQGRGNVPMKELQIGDLVLTGVRHQNYHFQPVYAFAHIQKTRPTVFLQIYTNSSYKTPLEATDEHLIYSEEMGPIRADSVQVGDVLQSPTNGPVAVISIGRVYRNGLYAPLTKDGTIVVGGVLASNYIAPQKQSKQSTVKLADPIGTVAFLNQADVIHWWLSPLRLICPSVGSSLLCDQRTTDGKLHYVDLGLRLVHWVESKSIATQMLAVVVVIALLVVPMLMEQLVASEISWEATLLIIVMMMTPYLQIRYKKKAKQA